MVTFNLQHVQLERDQIQYKILNNGVQPTTISLSLSRIDAFVIYL